MAKRSPKTGNGYSLDCSYYDKEFDTVEELVESCMDSGMDPNYTITRDGKLTPDTLIDQYPAE